MNLVIGIAGALLAARLGAELLLSALNRAEVLRWRSAPPAAAAAVMDAGTFAKSADYTLAKSRFGAWSGVFDTAVLAAVLFGGVLPGLYAAFARWGAPDSSWTGALFVIASLILLSTRWFSDSRWRCLWCIRGGFCRGSTG
jgi:STE24 endopeptidase